MLEPEWLRDVRGDDAGHEQNLPELSRQPTEGVAAMRTSEHSSIPGGGDVAQANYELTVVGSLATHSPGGVRPARVPSSHHYFEIQLDRSRGVCDANGLIHCVARATGFIRDGLKVNPK